MFLPPTSVAQRVILDRSAMGIEQRKRNKMGQKSVGWKNLFGEQWKGAAKTLTSNIHSNKR